MNVYLIFLTHSIHRYETENRRDTNYALICFHTQKLKVAPNF
jgi:hypothetical protein